MDLNCLSHWFPLLEDAGLPVPKTRMVEMAQDEREAVYRLLDGEDVGDPRPFFKRLESAIDDLGTGYPVFLRTGHTSGKHGWKRTCFLKRAEDIPCHVVALVEYSELAGIMGLPYNLWAVREFLPTEPFGHCPNYGNMPVCREFRAFVENGQIKCRHPYWPLKALQEGGFQSRHGQSLDGAYQGLCALRDGLEFDHIACAASAAVDGAWSVDIIDTTLGWHVTDMAHAEESFHWPGCVTQEADE